MLRYDRQIKPGLVALYDIRPGNGAGPFLHPGARTGQVRYRKLDKQLAKTNLSRRLKQFDGLSWLTLTTYFYDRSPPLTSIKYNATDLPLCVFAASVISATPYWLSGAYRSRTRSDWVG